MSSTTFSCTPPEIRQIAEKTINNLLPEKSYTMYQKRYKNFEKWCKEKEILHISENVLLAYFEMLRKDYKSSSLWSIYSMLRSCLNVHRNVDISKYMKLQALLKRLSKGYQTKKSKILEEEDIHRFLKQADDKIYLAIKVSVDFISLLFCKFFIF